MTKHIGSSHFPIPLSYSQKDHRQLESLRHSYPSLILRELTQSFEYRLSVLLSKDCFLDNHVSNTNCRRNPGIDVEVIQDGVWSLS